MPIGLNDGWRCGEIRKFIRFFPYGRARGLYLGGLWVNYGCLGCEHLVASNGP
jgi:hypothetical protein